MEKKLSISLRLLKLIKIASEDVGSLFVEGFYILALFAIQATIVVAAIQAFIAMMLSGKVGIEGILLLFIYLELGAIVGIYFKTNHMPVRFLIYVAITALTRLLIGLVNIEHQQPRLDLLIATAAIFILSVCVLILRFGSYKYPSDQTYKNPPDFDAKDS